MRQMFLYLGLVVGVLGIWWLSNRTIQPKELSSSSVPEIVIEGVDDVAVTRNGIVVFDRTSRQFRRYHKNELEQLATLPTDVGEIVVDPEGSLAFVRFPEKETLQWKLIEIQSGQVLSNLDIRAGLPSFAPHDQRVIYEFRSPTTHTLSVADKTLVDWKPILSLGEAPIQNINWLGNETRAIFIERGEVEETLKLVAISSKRQETLGSITDKPSVSPSGKYLIWWNRQIEAPNPNTAELVEFTDGEVIRRSLDLNSSSDLVAWEGATDVLYALAPIDAPGLQRIELTTNTVTTILTPEQVSEQLLSVNGQPLGRLVTVTDGVLYVLAGKNLYQFSLPE